VDDSEDVGVGDGVEVSSVAVVDVAVVDGV